MVLFARAGGLPGPEYYLGSQFLGGGLKMCKQWNPAWPVFQTLRGISSLEALYDETWGAGRPASTR